jgi:hypothetical protein
MMRSALAVAAALTALSAVGCSKTYIPNTDVEDTGENKAVIMFCERYRHAVEDKNVAELLKLASPGYFQGSVKNENIYDYNGLRQYLVDTFPRTTGIRYEIRYRRVTYTDTNHIFVDFTYAAAYRVPGVKGDEWHHKVADDRLDIVRDKDDYKIVSGM